MEVIKPEHEILKECLQKIARTHDQMVEYAIGKIQDLQRITMEIINEEEMIDIVDRYIRSNEDTGPAKYEPVSDKQSEDERWQVRNLKSCIQGWIEAGMLNLQNETWGTTMSKVRINPETMRCEKNGSIFQSFRQGWQGE